MQINIVSFNPDDLLEIAKVDLECFGAKESYPVSFFRQAFDIFGDLLYIAKTCDHQIIGYITGAINPKTTQGWVFAIGVLPQFRQKGVGNLLLQTLIGELGKREVSQLLLTVSPENRPAISLYQKFGFCKQKTVANYFGQGKPKIIFACEL